MKKITADGNCQWVLESPTESNWLRWDLTETVRLTFSLVSEFKVSLYVVFLEGSRSKHCVSFQSFLASHHRDKSVGSDRMESDYIDKIERSLSKTTPINFVET